MPNWCSASYAIEGDAEEVKSLYKLMKRLQEQKEPSVPNGFGKTWMGCLVNALGGDYNKIHCRGDWSNLEMEGNILKFTTETAWSPCDETFELVCEKFPTLCYFYQSEEPGLAEYWTNDQWYKEYFVNQTEIFKWFEEISGQSVESITEILAIAEQWKNENDKSFCNIYEYAAG